MTIKTSSGLILDINPGSHALNSAVSCGIAGNIAPVPVQHIKINKVDKRKAVEIPIQQRLRYGQSLGVVCGTDSFPHALPGKDIVDFADADCVKTGRLQVIQQGWRRRLQ